MLEKLKYSLHITFNEIYKKYTYLNCTTEFYVEAIFKCCNYIYLFLTVFIYNCLLIYLPIFTHSVTHTHIHPHISQCNECTCNVKIENTFGNEQVLAFWLESMCSICFQANKLNFISAVFANRA